MHCGYHGIASPAAPTPKLTRTCLQPFNTVKNELFLAAGLWQSPILRGALPTDRFTVVCNYHVIGVLKAVALRWSPTGNFGPVDQSVAVGDAHGLRHSPMKLPTAQDRQDALRDKVARLRQSLGRP